LIRIGDGKAFREGSASSLLQDNIGDERGLTGITSRSGRTFLLNDLGAFSK
jgi:hypothetical protein